MFLNCYFKLQFCFFKRRHIIISGTFLFLQRWLKSIVFCDMTPCNLVDFQLHFGATYFSPSSGSSALIAACCWIISCFTIQTWRWWQYIPPTCQWMCTKQHGIIYQMTQLFAVCLWHNSLFSACIVPHNTNTANGLCIFLWPVLLPVFTPRLKIMQENIVYWFSFHRTEG
jgi:hypothetical protein